MAGIKFYIVDVESTGLSAKIHEVNEISIIRYDDRIQLTEFIKCEYPERASWDALKITKKTMADLALGNSKEAAVEKIDKFLNSDGLTPAHRCFIAHNWNFDKKMIHALYNKVNKSCPVNLWLCSMALTKFYAKNAGFIKPKVGLNDACNMMGIKKIAGAHASKVDARNTYLLFKDLIDNRKIDYLPFIKTEIHENKFSVDDEPDMSILDDFE